jgi:hypothetical protein
MMKVINESHSLFHEKIIAYLEEYAPEPNKCFKSDDFAKKEKTNTRELAWIIAVLKRKCPYGNIPWGDQNLCEYVDAIDNIFHKKIADEIQMCHNLFEITSLPTSFKTEAIYKKLGISWDITHDRKGKGINTYWIDPLEDSWSSISLRLIESVGGDLFYKQKPELLKVRENKENKLYRHNLAEKNLTAELARNLRVFCNNAPVTFIPTQLPEKIWLKYLAHYLAISSKKYPDYGDVEYNDERLLNNAMSIHKLLREKLSGMLEIKLGERALMLPAHRDVADQNGILDIAVVAKNPEREIPDDWSVEVTKELALSILLQLDEFSSLLVNHKVNDLPRSKQHPQTSSKLSDHCNDNTRSLYLAVERILDEDNEQELAPTAIWNTLLTKKDNIAYKILSVEKHSTRSYMIKFKCGNTFKYHAAQNHIKKIVTWFMTR